MITVTIFLVIFIAALIQSTFGFGLALTAMPLLAMYVRITTATPLVVMIGFVVVMGILLKDWRDIHLKEAWSLVISSVAGIPVGLYLLKGLHDEILKIFLAFIIIVFASYMLITSVKVSLKSGVLTIIAGFLAGVLGGAYNTGGPPVIIYGRLKQWSPERFRATLQSIFLPNCILIMLGHISVGLWTPSVLKLFLYCLPACMAGTFIGSRLNRAIAPGVFDRYIYILLICIGLLLFYQSV